MAEQAEEFITVQDLAVLLKVKPVTIYRGVESGEIPHHRIGRQIRFSRQDVETYLGKVRVAVAAE